MSTKVVKPLYLRGFVSGRLIPLEKNPGIRPIGIGEVSRRIVAKATISLLKPDLIEATAPLQTCAGIRGGIEASIHAMRRMYEEESTEAILLVDASNAFNSLNRQAALHNLQYICPELSNFAKNLYSCNAELFIAGSEDCIYSREGTIQGGPESMALYAASTVPLVYPDLGRSEEPKRIFYADDGAGAGKLDGLLQWWTQLQRDGPLLGYIPNPAKTWLIVKPGHMDRAKDMFPDVNLTEEGHKYLGSFIGNEDGTAQFMKGQVDEWCKDVDALVKVAETEPQLAFSAYLFGTSKRWQFVCRTTPNVSGTLQKLEEKI